MAAKIKSIHFFFLPLLWLVFFSCNSDKKESAEAGIPESAEPTEDQLLQLGIQKLNTWTDFWASKGADFNPENFDLNQEHIYEVVEWPGKNVLIGDHPLKAYQFPNPLSKGVVDIYDYKLVVDEEKQVDYNPDAEVVYYKANGMRERLLFIGPSGVFEDAVWISESHLLVSGHIQNESGFVPVIWLIIPEEHRYSVYENRFVTQDYSPDSYLKEKLRNLKFLR